MRSESKFVQVSLFFIEVLETKPALLKKTEINLQQRPD